MIKELIDRTLERRNEAQRAHWGTKSYAQHVALEGFYDDLLDGLDKYVEAYQGAFGLVAKADDLCPTLKEDVVWLTKNRKELARNVPSLENILDELVGVYLKALYKLENLE